MAREYEMLFKLNAQMGSAYQQTFKSAQASIKSFSGEYRSLSSTASDITGYQRQQSACESTKAKLDMLRQQYDNIQREMDETGNSSSDLQNKLLAKKAQIDKTTAAYQAQIEKLEAYKQRLQEAGVNTDNLEEEEKQLREELKRLREQYDQTGASSEEMGEKGSDAMADLGAAIAAAGIVQGLKTIYNAFADCIDVTAEFEAGVSQIAATMGVTTDEITDLSAFAKEMGAATSFSAVQSADALNVLAMAGLDAEQQIAALPTVLDLAAAGAMEISTAAGYVTGAVKGFSDQMSNSAYYADLMAKGATMANTNVDQLGSALSMAAATASSYGQEADSVTVALLRLAEQNVTGSEAATKLNRAMADLYTPTEEAAAALAELGVAVYDERGNARDLNVVMDELNTALSAYSMEQQNAYKDTIFSMNGLQAFNKMTVSSTETVNKFWDGLANASGSAAEQATTQLDNFKGSVTIMNSAIEGTKIAFGELYTESLQKIAEVLTNIFGGITTFIQQCPVLTKLIVSLTVGLAAFVVGLTAYVAVAKIAEKAQRALNAAMEANPFLLAGAAIAGLVVGLGTFVATIGTATKEEEELTAASQAQAKHIEELNAEYEQVCETMGETSAEAQLLKQQLDEESEAFEQTKKTAAEFREELDQITENQNESTANYQAIMEGIQGEYDGTMNLINRLNELTAAEEQSAASKEQIVAIVDILNQRIPELGLNYDLLSGKLNMTADDIVTAARRANNSATRDAQFQELQQQLAMEEQVTAAYNEAAENVRAAEDRYNAAMAAVTANDKRLLGSEYDGTQHATYVYGSQEAADYSELLEAQEEYEAAQADYDVANQNYIANQEQIIDLSNELAGTTDELSGVMGDASVYVNDLNSRMNALTEAYNKAYEAAYDSISGQFKLWDDAATVSATSVQDVIKAQEDQAKYWSDYQNNLDWVWAYTDELEGLSEFVTQFADGSAESVNMIAGISEALQAGDIASVQAMIDAWQANTEAQSAAAESIADIETNYTNSMGTLSAEFAQMVEDLDLTDEAYDAAESTIQGYIDAAEQMLPLVSLAYGNVGKAAIDALRGSVTTGDETGDGYASGTESATPGFHLVGENGPELMFFNGGEQVLTAEDTAALMNNRPEPVGISLGGGGENVTITFAPQYTISGEQNAEEVRAILVAHDAELLDQLRGVLAEEKEDARRRAYV